MIDAITGNTEIHLIVNGIPTFEIKNSPETGLLWATKLGMNKEDYVQGLYAIIEAAHNISMHKIKVDSKRVLESNKPFDKG